MGQAGPCDGPRRGPDGDPPRTRPYTSPPVSDLPLILPADVATRLTSALDRERKIGRALEAVGPIAGRDVVVVGGGLDELAGYRALGARLTSLEPDEVGSRWPLADGSADAIVSVWSAFRGIDAGALAEADRVLRPAGRLIIVHDYGRDDVSRIRGGLPDHVDWSRRDGPFLANGFRVRVIHCFWTFETIGDARSFLGDAFGDAGRTFGEGLTRPRLSYNVAIYHRSRGGKSGDAGARDT